jgi:hypothetical protein
MKNGYSEPFFMTDEECGQKFYAYASVRASPYNQNIAFPNPT